MREKIGAHRVLVEKSERRIPRGRPMRGWEDDIKMDLLEVGWLGVDRIDLAQDRERWQVAGSNGCAKEPSACIKCRELRD
jgi:hypothetical protein